jgi:iron complex outermembrane receptor protein
MTANWNADGMFGPGASITGTAEDISFRADAIYDLSPKWQVNGRCLWHRHIDPGQRGATQRFGVQPCAKRLYFGGHQWRVAIGSQALTTANAIDLWGNGTSAATKTALVDNRQFQYARHCCAMPI